VASACRSADGDLVAILPIYLWSERLGVVRFIGHDAGDQLGPICASADSPAAGQALRRILRDSTFGWSVFLGDWLPGNEGWSDMLGGKVVRREGNPFVRLRAASWGELTAGWSKQELRNVERRERNLRRAHDVSFHLAVDPERFSHDLDSLFALHKARWTASSTFAGHEAFHRDFAQRAFEQGWARLWLLEVDGRPIAAQYNFRYGGVESAYQGGWDADWARLAPAKLLVVHAIRQAFEDGLLEYRFLRGAEEYKYRFAHDDRGLETIAVVKGARGRALLAAALAAKRFRLL
jgi:CelD/BcsL family acetyltransferase involved in cellulose biosynthesis